MDNIDNFRKKNTHKIGNRLEIDDPGVKLIVNFDNKKRQAKGNRQVNIDNILLKQLDVKDQQIAKLQKALDQQQQLQLTTAAENHELKEHMRKLNDLIEISKTLDKRQTGDKKDNLSNENKTSNIVDKIDKQPQNKIVKLNSSSQIMSKSKAKKNWWNFWKS